MATKTPKYTPHVLFGIFCEPLGKVTILFPRIYSGILILSYNSYTIISMHKAMINVKNILYFLLIVALFSVFLNRFGIPACEDLLRQDVVFKESHSVNMESPAITICMVFSVLNTKHFDLIFIKKLS